jgi:hypothetical protein
MLSNEESVIVQLIEHYTAIWKKEDKWVDPSSADSLLFLFTELIEYLEDKTDEEAFDCVLMSVVTAKKLSFNLENVSTNLVLEDKDLLANLRDVAEFYLRTGQYIRNNDKFPSGPTKLKAIFNTMINRLGDNPIEVAINKLTSMHLNRVGFVTASNLTKCFDEVTDNFTELSETLKNSLISPKSLEELQASLFRLSEYIYE